MKRNLNRGISLLLSVCLVLGILAVPGIIPVRAESTETTPEAGTTQTVFVTEKNLIANGTFDEVRDVSYYTSKSDGDLGWGYTNMPLMQIEATNAYTLDGAYSLHVKHANNASASSVWRAIQLPEYTANETEVKLSVNVRGTIDADGCYISVQFRDGDDGNGNSLKSYTEYLDSSDSWKEYVAEGVIPSGAKSARIYIAYCRTNFATDIYLDDVSLTIGGSEISLTNASFDNLPEGATASVTEMFFLNKEGWVAEKNIASKIQTDATGENGLLYLDGTKAEAAAYSHYYPIQVEGGATYKAVFNYKSTGEYVHLYANEFNAEGERIKQQFQKFAAKADLNGATEYTFKATQGETVEVQLRPYFHKDYDGEAWLDNIAYYKVCTHDFSGEPVVTAATCTEEGASVITCPNCEATQTTIIPALGHDFTSGTCPRCGEVCPHADVDKGVCNVCSTEIPKHVEPYNLITNGSFQSIDPAYTWNMYDANNPTMELSTKTVHSGKYSVKFHRAARDGDGASAGLKQTITLAAPLEADTEFTLSAWTYSDAEVDRRISLQATFPKGTTLKAGTYLGTSTETLEEDVTLTKDSTYTLAYVSNSVAGWNQSELSIVVPAGATKLNVNVYLPKSTKEATIYADDVFLGTTDGENLVTNPSFEMSLTFAGWTPSQAYVAFERDANGNLTQNGILVHNDDKTNQASAPTFYPEVELGATYRLSFKYKYISGTAPAVFVRQYYKDAAGKTQQADTKLSMSSGNTTWTNIGPTEFTVRADATEVRIFPNIGSAAIGLSYFDDFVLVKVCNAHNFQNPVVSEANCTTGAVRTVTCVDCGAIGTTVVSEAGDHTWDNGVIDPDATCTSEGVKTYTCDTCGITKTEAVSAKGHTAAEAVVENNVAATCTADGSYDTVIYCSVCNAELSRETTTVTATGHNYNAVVTAPTCTEAGYTTYTCACGHSYVADEVAAKGHAYSAEVTAPTCTAGGYTTYTCACGDSYVADQVAALGHAWDDGVIDPDSTCTADGVKTYTCGTCGDTYTEAVSAKGHTAADAVVENNVAATCTAAGSYDTVVYCSVCNAELSRETTTVPATGHAYSAEVTAPTCTEAGYTTYTCACGDTYVADQVAALGHAWDDGVIDPDSTCTAEGVKTYTCGTCGDTYTEAVSAKGHTAAEAVIENNVAATCTADGSYDTVVYCSVCNAELSRVTTTVDALGHTAVTDAAVAPTCTATGLTEGKHCSVCGKTLTAQEVIPAKGHKYTGKVTTEPTYNTTGIETFTCGNCGDSYTVTIPVKTGAAAQIGTTKYGTLEEAYYAAATGAGTTIKLLENVTWTGESGYHIPSTGLTLDLGGKTLSLVNKQSLQFVGENFTIMNGTVDGLGASYGLWIGNGSKTTKNVTIENVTVKGGVNISVATNVTLINCNVNADVEKADNDYYAIYAFYSTGIVVESGTYTAAEGKAAICVEHAAVTVKGGTFSTNVTSFCEEGKHTAPDGNGAYVYGTHSYDDGVVTTNPTCTSEGVKTYTCACGETKTEAVSVKDHTAAEAVIENKVAASCTNDGSYDTVVYCSVCGAELSRETTTVDAIGHNYTSEITTQPTYNTPGVETFTCSNCGDTYTESISATVTGLTGSGTVEDPYLINNLDELKWFRDDVNNGNRYNGKVVKLNADIDLEDEEWIPIGDRNVDQGSFLGTFDGANHTISNLWISEWTKSGAGFFSKVGLQSENVTGAVKNVTFNNVTIISTQSYVGLIAQAPSGALIENVKITGEVTIQGYGYVGGIVGHGYPTMDNCSVKAEGYIISNYWGVGAILGFSGDYGSKVTNSTVIGTGDGLLIHGNYGGAAAVTGSPYGAAVDGAYVENVTITSNSDYCMGYVAAGGTVTNATITNVTATASGAPITPADAVATIGNNVYFSLPEAFEAAVDGDTVELLADVELTETLVIPADKVITLDLNSFDISYSSDVAGEAMITNKGTLTLTGNGAVNFTYTGAVNMSKAANAISNLGNLTIDGVSVTNTTAANGQIGYAVDNYSSAVLTVESGSVTVSGSYYYDAIRMFCNSETADNTVVINGGAVGTIWMQNPSDGATRNTKDTVKGNLTINGGTVGTVYLEPCAAFEVSITGGTIAGVQANDTANSTSTSVPTGFISGGTFAQDVTDYCVDGYHTVANAEGKYVPSAHEYAAVVTAPTCTEAGYTTYTCTCGHSYVAGEVAALGHNYVGVVTKEPTLNEEGVKTYTCSVCGDSYTESIDKLEGAAATINGANYATLQEAIGAAGEGDTIKLLANAELNALVLMSGISLDLNGYTLETSYVVGFKGSDVIDSSAANTGLLKVAMDKVMLSLNNSQLPVYNAALGGYQFLEINIKTDLTEDTVNDVATFKFYIVKDADYMMLLDLMRDGAADNNLTVMVKLSWITEGDGENAGNKATQYYAYSENMNIHVAEYHSTSQYSTYTCELKGINSRESISYAAVLQSGTKTELTFAAN